MVYSDAIEDKIDLIMAELKRKYPNLSNYRWHAIKLLEQDKEISARYPVNMPDVIDRNYESDIINEKYDFIEEILPKDIFFITTQELEDLYPDKTPKEREYIITKEKGAVCLMQIGDKLASGEPHDGRAPDYDDWKLNADIIVYYPVLDIALELSSMGIRVDADALRRQLKLAGCEERAELPFQKAILENDLPFTIGGGIGQSRICMFYLRKAHIGEVQCSIWPDEIIKEAAAHNIQLL